MRYAVIVLIVVLLLFLGMFGVAYTATARPGGSIRQLDIPVGGGHMITMMLVPCSPVSGGYVMAGYDLFLSSRYPPVGWRLPSAPRCP